TTGQVWQYLHIFTNGALPLTVGRFQLGRQGAIFYIARLRANNSNQVEAAYVAERPGMPPPNLTVNGQRIRARDCVNAGDFLAPMGNSGAPGTPVHLHLGLNARTDDDIHEFVADNPFLFLKHADSQFSVEVRSPRAGQVLTARDNLNIEV